MFATLLFAFAAAAIFAQNATRVKFGKGTQSATVSGHLNNYKSEKVFIIRVRKGQTLRTEQIKSNNSLHYTTVSIKSPSGKTVGDSDASCNNRKETEPTRTVGDYKITVFECRKADAWRGRFHLKVIVK